MELPNALSPPPCYAVGMGRIIRRTITITITETCTITWATGDDPLSHPSTIVPDKPTPKEEPDEVLHATLSDAQLSDPTATTPTPATAPDARTEDVVTKPSADKQRTSRRRVKEY